jgi:hypothetical protein
MLTLCTFCLSLASGVPVEISLPAGQTQQGELIRLATDEVTIVADGKEQPRPTEQLRRIQFGGPAADVPANPTEARLTDGSTLLLSDLRTEGESATLQWIDGSAPATVPVRALRSVLFGKLAAAHQQQWDQWLLAPPAADAVVVQARNGQLQAIEGVLEAVTETHVRFLFEGDTNNLPRGRVLGLLYFAGASPEKYTSRASLRTKSGSVLQLRTIQLSDSQLALQTANGTSLDLALDRVDYLDFAVISVAYLSDLEPEKQQFAAYLQLPAIAAIEEKWFGPQRDRQISRQELSWVNGDVLQASAKGLGLHSQSEMVYRLAGQYRRFMAVASVDSTEAQGQVTLVVAADGKEQLRKDLGTGGPPLEVDLDITGANRLTIRVEYGDSSDQGDHVSLCDARLLK